MHKIRFVLRTFNKRFKSHDLGSTAQLLRKETDPMRKSDILDLKRSPCFCKAQRGGKEHGM